MLYPTTAARPRSIAACKEVADVVERRLMTCPHKVGWSKERIWEDWDRTARASTSAPVSFAETWDQRDAILARNVAAPPQVRAHKSVLAERIEQVAPPCSICPSKTWALSSSTARMQDPKRPGKR